MNAHPWTGARRWLLAVFAPAGLLTLAACSDTSAPDVRDPIALHFSLQAADGVSEPEGAALGEAFDRVDRYHVRVEDALSRALYADTVIRVTPGSPEHELGVGLPESALGATLEVTLTALAGEVEMFTATVRATASRTGTGSGASGTAVEVGVRYTGPGIRGSVTGNDGRGVGGATVQVMRGGQPVASATTAADGSYLLLDLPPGTYVVRTEAKPGLVTCPGDRSVTLTAPTDAAVAAFQYRAGTCTARVLVLSGGDVDDTGAARGLLAGVPELEVDAFFFVSSTPGIETLRTYDVVLLYQNGLFDESVDLGRVLAQYVSLGGNVVFGSFYWQGRSDSGLGSPGWGALEGLDPFTSTGGANYTPSTLGTVVAHPLTAGVTSLSSSGYRGGVAAKSGTAVVARWADGVPLVGHVGGSAGQRLVAVSLYPGHSAVGGVSGDFARLWRNAVVWAGQAGGPARTGPVGGS